MKFSKLFLSPLLRLVHSLFRHRNRHRVCNMCLRGNGKRKCIFKERCWKQKYLCL